MIDSSVFKYLNIPQIYIGKDNKLPAEEKRDPNGIYVTEDTGKMLVHGNIPIGKYLEDKLNDFIKQASGGKVDIYGIQGTQGILSDFPAAVSDSSVNNTDNITEAITKITNILAGMTPMTSEYVSSLVDQYLTPSDTPETLEN